MVLQNDVLSVKIYKCEIKTYVTGDEYMDKRERTERAKQEDAVLMRALIWIVGSVVLEALLLLLNRYYNNYRVSEIGIRLALDSMFRVLAVVLPVCFLAAAVWWAAAWKKGRKSGLAQAAATILAILSACALIVRFFTETGVKGLYVGVPCMAVLALVYYLYQREFFAVTLMCAAGLLGLWLMNRRITHGAVVYSYLVVEFLFLAAMALTARKLQSGSGAMNIRGRRVQLLGKNVNYTMLYLTCLAVALVQVMGLVMGVMTLLYAVLIVWLLAMAVYYTVRLM